MARAKMSGRLGIFPKDDPHDTPVNGPSHPLDESQQKMAVRAAKEFLIAGIVDEAQREGVSLSDVERRMLYFSEENGEPDELYDLSDEFEQSYDRGEYETKIAGLICNARRRCRAEDKQEFDAWSRAIRTLRREDHYLVVMIDQAEASPFLPGGRPGPHDQLYPRGSCGRDCVCLRLLFPFSFSWNVFPT
jgi:hypothetical protein